jgi:dihydrofolate synthase/folylpolyglutamate synthase
LLVAFRERIQINGKDISESEVSRCLPELFEMCEKNGLPATFFELTTALAFMQFKAAKCEAVVLEVGLGGRLDSTNVVTPTISAITSVQLDHMNVLGDTIEKIAKEKAGIMKPGVPVIIGPGCPMDVMKVL